MLPTSKKNKTAESFDVLRARISRLFSGACLPKDTRQLSLPWESKLRQKVTLPTESLAEFFDFLAAALPDGEIYLFGGVLRDLALFGREGFSSDIDIVIEGDWLSFSRYLGAIGATKNKFGGFRLEAGQWPIDIWNAKDTWAIRQGYVRYEGIESLTRTTVLNWDAILMDWRTKKFICSSHYLEDLRDRSLDIVLEENPNPKGMAVRVFRHLSAKDAKRVTKTAALYLEKVTERYSFDELKNAELASYGNSIIEPLVYRFFASSRSAGPDSVGERFYLAAETLARQGVGPEWQQLNLSVQPDLPV